jgi:hypothetical protein
LLTTVASLGLLLGQCGSHFLTHLCHSTINFCCHARQPSRATMW